MKRSIRPFALLLALVTALAVSCSGGSGNNPKQHLALLAAAGNTPASDRGAVNLSLAIPGAEPASSGPFVASYGVSTEAVSDVAKVTLEISAPDMGSPMSVNLIQYNGSWGGVVGSIPAGTDRTFVARAYDSGNNLIYQGTVSGVTIVAGSTTPVFILLQDTAPADAYGNIAPLIDALSLSTDSVVPGDTISLAVTAHDDNAGDTISYAWSATGGSFDNAASTTPVWTAPASTGAYTLTIQVTDSSGAVASMNVVVNVETGVGSGSITTGFNTFPVVSSVTASPTGLDVNETTTLGVTASDADGDTLTYLWSSDCGGSFDNDTSATPVFTAPASYPADNKCTLTVTANDGNGGTNTGSITIHVRTPLQANLAPVIVTAYQNTADAMVNDTVLFYVEAADPELHPLTFTWSSSAGTLQTPVSTTTTSQVEFSSTTPGVNTITVRVEDGGVLYTEYSFTLNVGTGEVILTASDPAANDFFGARVSVSGDYLIASASGVNGSGYDQGAAYIFKRDSVTGQWIERQKLTPSVAQDNSTFAFVNISGNYAMVGASHFNGTGVNQGAVFVYERDTVTDQWSEIQILTASDAADNDYFAYSIDLDGDYAVIATPYNDEETVGGAAYVFERDPGTGLWSEKTKLSISDGLPQTQYGFTCSISGDTIVVGARSSDGALLNIGAAYVYQRDPATGNWNELQKLVPAAVEAQEQFGYQVAVHGDKMLVNSYFANQDSVLSAGAVYYYRKNATTGLWEEISKVLSPEPEASGGYGGSLALSDNHAFLAARNMDEGGTNRGAVYRFDYDSGTNQWVFVEKITQYNAHDSDGFGSVEVDGNAGFIGLSNYSGPVSKQGAVYVYDLTP